MINPFERLDTGMRGLRVKRMHAMPVHRNQTVGEHTAGILYILHILGWDEDVELWRAALFHDMGEGVVGDMPHPAKKEFPELGAAYAEAERALADRNSWYPHRHLTEKDQKRLRIADMLEFAYQMREEYLMGNRHPGTLDAITLAMSSLNRAADKMQDHRLSTLVGELMVDFRLWERNKAKQND